MIWDDSITGHHLEYIHHIYEAAVSEEAEFIFVLPEDFQRQKYLMIWAEAHNISFDFMPIHETSRLKGGYIKSSLRRSLSIRKYALKHHVDDVFLNVLCLPYPLLPLFIPQRVRVSGVIYQIYLYKWKALTLPVKLKYVLETWGMAKSRCTKHLLVLNDSTAVRYYNKLYKTDKFKAIVDPVVLVSNDTSKYNRSTYGIPNNSMMFLHFGAMDDRKGTLEILQALLLLKQESLKDKCFVFAGKIGAAIKVEFYKLSSAIKMVGVNIIVFDAFCEFGKLDELCYLGRFS